MNIDNEAAADLLDGAADYLDEHGWRQGSTGKHGGRRCVVGALTSAVYEVVGRRRRQNHDILYSAYVALGNHICVEEGREPMTGSNGKILSPGISVWQWNDTPGRTKDDVTNGLRKTALTLREQA